MDQVLAYVTRSNIAELITVFIFLSLAPHINIES